MSKNWLNSNADQFFRYLQKLKKEKPWHIQRVEIWRQPLTKKSVKKLVISSLAFDQQSSFEAIESSPTVKKEPPIAAKNWGWRI